MNRELLEAQLSELPLYVYYFVEPKGLEFSERIRWICEHECPMYGKTWACPPGVGSVAECDAKCGRFQNALLIGTIVEVADIANIDETLSTRGDHEQITNQVRDLMRQQGVDPYVLSTEACALCDHCAYLDGQPCRFPETMHPCIESHGINIIPLLESCGLEFQFGDNMVTWYSLLLFND